MQRALWHIRKPTADLCNVNAPRGDVHAIMLEATLTFAEVAGRQGGKNEGVGGRGGSAENREGEEEDRHAELLVEVGLIVRQNAGVISDWIQ